MRVVITGREHRNFRLRVPLWFLRFAAKDKEYGRWIMMFYRALKKERKKYKGLEILEFDSSDGEHLEIYL